MSASFSKPVINPHPPCRGVRGGWEWWVVVGILTTIFTVGCDRPYRSTAADVPGVDVRRISDARKARVPDEILRTADVGRVLGADSTTRVVFIVSDYACPECGQWFASTWPVIRAQYVETGKIRVSWVHYPQRTYPNAVRAANAALCASAEGKFWDASARLFATSGAWRASTDTNMIVDSLVSIPGLDAYTMRLCVDGRRMWRQIRADIDWADTRRVGTPLMVVAGHHHVPGTASVSAVQAAIDSLLAGK